MSPDGCVALPCGAWVCLGFVIVVFSDHTHLLFLSEPSLLANVISNKNMCAEPS